ncbi:uncharacterized protein [Manis javanica]|uniref:uncharacterized protein isoform X2 n=1 Tax=Manis javanica TaxID=9974 RepID=UPI003C6D6010
MQPFAEKRGRASELGTCQQGARVIPPSSRAGPHPPAVMRRPARARPAPRPPASSCPARRSSQTRKRPAGCGGDLEKRLASKKDSRSLRPKSGKRGGGRQRRSREWLFLSLKKVYRGDPRNSGTRTRAADFCGCPEAGARERRQQGALGDQTAALTGVLKEEEAVKEKDELLREAQAEAARERQLRSIELKDDCCPVRGGDKTQTDTGEMAVGRQAETGVPAEETLSDDTWTSDFQPPEQCRNRQHPGPSVCSPCVLGRFVLVSLVEMVHFQMERQRHLFPFACCEQWVEKERTKMFQGHL